MPTPNAVLIVDADPKGLESLVYGFQGADWRITACPSLESAPLLVKASGAQVIVIASRTEHEKTHALVRQLRGPNDPCKLPVLVLGPEEVRPSVKEDDHAYLLPLPAFVRDVLSASELLVATSTVEAPDGEPSLHIPATSAKTLSLVRTMNGLGRSGRLRLERNGRAGEILFHQGELTAASVGPLQGMAAVQHLMIWNDGKAELRLRHVPRRGQLHLNANEFMLEMDRFQRDFSHALKEIGPARAVYSANQQRLKQAGGAVPAEVTPVVRLCNGNRTLADVIDESPFRVLDTVRILGRLAELGVLTRSDGKPLVPHPNEEFLNSARISDAQQAWPMPAPITTPASGTPILRTAAPAAPASDASPAAPESAAAATAASTPPVEPRRRRQTLELGVPPVAEPPAPAGDPTVPAAPAAIATTPQPAADAPTPSVPLPPPSATVLQASGAFHPPASTAAAPPTTGTSPTPLLQMAPTPPPARRPAEITHAAGVIDSSKNVRRSQSMRATGEHPSVVIDTTAADPAKTPAPATIGTPPSATSSGNLPASGAPRRTSTPPFGGTLEVQPSRRNATQVIPVGRVSIELDSSLTSAATNAPVQPTAPAPKSETGIRVTGEMHIPPSGRTSRSMDKPAAKASSFHIDPSLTADPHGSGKTPRPVRVDARGSDKTPRPVQLGSQPGAQKRSDSRPIPLGRSDSRPIEGNKRHQSGSFSTIEADFFAREADLYREEKAESFADLDEKAGKSAKGKGKGAKPGRPHRK